MVPVFDPKNQSIPHPWDDSRISSWINRPSNLRQWAFDDAKTLYQSFRRGAQMSDNGRCLGWRDGSMEYQWIKYGEAIQRSENLARGFVHKGLAIGQKTYVGIYSNNRPEWIITEQACYYYNMVLVPLFETLSRETCAYIIGQTEMTLIVVEKLREAEWLLSNRANFPALSTIVVMDPIEGLGEKAAAAGLDIVQYCNLEKEGEIIIHQSPPPSPPSAEDICTIAYTIQSEGIPMGAMLSHGNVIAATTIVLPLQSTAIDTTTTLFSVLPAAYMLERVMEAAVFSAGGRVGFSSGNREQIFNDMKALKPTTMAAAPWLMEWLYGEIMRRANKNFLTWAVFRQAMAAKRRRYERGISGGDTILDRFAFGTIRDYTGGNLSLIVNASAPVGDKFLSIIQCVLDSVIILQGFGPAESCGVGCLTFEEDKSKGHVGPPIPCAEVKLIDVPELGLFSGGEIGEICIKGYNVFKAYFKEYDRTTAVLDTDGWLRTGYIGYWTPEGTLKMMYEDLPQEILPHWKEHMIIGASIVLGIGALNDCVLFLFDMSWSEKMLFGVVLLVLYLAAIDYRESKKREIRRLQRQLRYQQRRLWSQQRREEASFNPSTKSKAIEDDDTLVDINTEILDVSHSSILKRPHPPPEHQRRAVVGQGQWLDQAPGHDAGRD